MTTPESLSRLPDPHLDLARPFTRADALRAGLTPDHLKWLLTTGSVRHMLRGVYVALATAESLELRVAALRLVVPDRSVVVDETAGWLHGATMILAPQSEPRVPAVHVFHRDAGCRLRNGVTASGERWLLDRDVEQIGGIQVTTPLRTATDLGRLRHRDQALASIDSLLGLGAFTHDELMGEVARFAGYRGVIQLRTLAPLGDARAQSPGESALRLRWLDAHLPAPQPQHPVTGPHGQTRWLDLADPTVRFAAEYDGERHHSLTSDVLHDEERRWFLTEHLGWILVVLRRTDVFGPRQQAESLLRAGYARARLRHEGHA